MKYIRNTFLKGITLGITVIILMVSCNSKENTVVIGSKNFTENIILAELIKQTIQKETSLTVKTKENLGSSFVVFEAMKSGDIDIYVDFTGTLYQANLKQTKRLSAEETYQYVQKEMKELYNFEVFPSFGFQNTYALGVKKSFAEQYNLKKISDLKALPTIRYAFDNEFAGRNDGADAMFKFYGITPQKNYLIVDLGLRYQTIIEDEADVIDAFSTDPQVKRFGIALLEDDKKFFPPYYAVPVARGEITSQYPEITLALQTLENILTEESIIELSYTAEKQEQSISEIIKEFLSNQDM